MGYVTIKEIKSPIKISRMLYLQDVATVIGYFVIMSFLSPFIHEYYKIPFYIVNVLWGCFFTLKSRYSPVKRNWEVILAVIIRDRNVYKPINRRVEDVR